MGCFAEMMMDRQNGREHVPEGFAAWCRVEDLCGRCGYDPADLFSVLPDIADGYSGRPGQDPDDYAEEHPMEALASAVRRYLADDPEAARMAAAAEVPAAFEAERPGPRAGRAA